MAAATLRPQMTAATEHGQAVLRLDDSKRKPSDSGSTDIRDYMQNKRSRHGPAEEDGKMEIGGILVDDGYSDEIEYLTCGEEETDDARSQIVCSLDECGKRAEMRVTCKNKYCLEWSWKYFCRTHLRAWECNSCGDDGWSESASAQDPPEEGEDQDLPDEDEEDEDNGSAQSLTVTTLASSSADGGVAQSLSVPQQVRNSENDGVAQSLSVAQQARRGNGVEMDMDMENQEERCWRLKVRNFLTDRESLEAESLHMIDPSGYTSAEADVREAIFRERLVRKQQQRNTSRSRALRQLAELDEREMEIESMGAEMLAAGSDEEEAPREVRNLALRNLIAGMNQWRAKLRARWCSYFDREVEDGVRFVQTLTIHTRQREVEERRRRDREDMDIDQEEELEAEMDPNMDTHSQEEWDAELDADDIMMIQTNYMNRAAGYSSAATSRDDSRPKIPITDLTSLIHDPSDQHRPQPHSRVLNDMKSLHSARQLARPREAGSAFCSPCDGSGNIMR